MGRALQLPERPAIEEPGRLELRLDPGAVGAKTAQLIVEHRMTASRRSRS